MVVPPVVDQIFKYTSVRGTFHIQTLADTKSLKFKDKRKFLGLCVGRKETSVKVGIVDTKPSPSTKNRVHCLKGYVSMPILDMNSVKSICLPGSIRMRILGK